MSQMCFRGCPCRRSSISSFRSIADAGGQASIPLPAVNPETPSQKFSGGGSTMAFEGFEATEASVVLLGIKISDWVPVRSMSSKQSAGGFLVETWKRDRERGYIL